MLSLINSVINTPKLQELNIPGLCDDFHNREPVIRTPMLAQREISQKLPLTSGRYVMIPHMDDPGQEGQFVIRTYTVTTCRIVYDFSLIRLFTMREHLKGDIIKTEPIKFR